jgi:hypothetical protein
MLRFYSHVFAAWIALAFGFVALVVAGVGQARTWIYGACAVTGISILLALNLANPEGIVVRLNVDHASSGHFDSDYIATLSDDATPRALNAISRLPSDQARSLRSRLCVASSGPVSWAGFTFAEDAAARARRAVCR